MRSKWAVIRQKVNTTAFPAEQDEIRRLKKLTRYEKKGYREQFSCIAGIDEAGRGPLAGPVVAAACVIPRGLLIAGVDDSKKLTPDRREALFQVLTSIREICFGIGIVDSLTIDKINILQATIRAMHEALDKLSCKPDLLLVDGMQLSWQDVQSVKIVKGDALSHSIAAASIIAKVTRDRMMAEYHKSHPEYGFHEHKGYGTEKHLEAIRKHGPVPSLHRMTFNGVNTGFAG